MAFIKYNDSPTIYTETGQAFSNANDFFAAGGAKDFSNVQNLNQVTPGFLKTAPIYSAPKPATPTVPVQVTPTPTIPSTQLNQAPKTTLDVQSLIQKNLDAQDAFLKQLGVLSQPTPEMMQTQTQLADANKNLQDFQNSQRLTGLQAQGFANPNNEPIPLPFLQGQAANAYAFGQLKESNLSNAVQNLQAKLQYAQNSRKEQLAIAQQAFDVQRQSIQDTLSLYKAFAPENILSKVDEDTGNILLVTKNPITGETTTQTAGNVKATSPFYKFENDPTVYSRDGRAFSTVEEFVAAGGSPDFSNVQTITQTPIQPVEVSPGNSLVDPTTGEVIYNAPFKPTASRSSGGIPSSVPTGSDFVGPIDPRAPLSPNAQAVVENPNVLKTYTPTLQGKVVAELQAAGYQAALAKAAAKPLSDTAIKEITQSEGAIQGLQNLKQKVAENQKYIGPLSGLQSLNPYSEGRKVQADINRVKQQVGKALEGGVLRKEDEEKYKKILSTLFDTPATAQYKIDALISSVQRDLDIYKSLQQGSGRNVPATTTTTGAEALRSKYNY